VHQLVCGVLGGNEKICWVFTQYEKRETRERTSHQGMSLLSLDGKVCVKWRGHSPIFVPSVAVPSKFSFYSNFSRNLESIPKTSTQHILSTSRKHTAVFLVKSFGECCGSAVLTAACYWQSTVFLLRSSCPCRRS